MFFMKVVTDLFFLTFNSLTSVEEEVLLLPLLAPLLRLLRAAARIQNAVHELVVGVLLLVVVR